MDKQKIWWNTFFQTKNIYVTSTLMRQFIFSLLSLCRQDLFEVFFPGTVSSTLFPFQELVCFMIVFSFQNLFLFRNYILFRNCFCQTNPFQELFFSNKSFSGLVFSKIVLWRVFWTEKLHDPDKIRSFIYSMLFQEVSCLTLPCSKPIAYHPLSGTVIFDTAFLKAYRIPSSFRNCHFWHCLFQGGSVSNPMQKMFLRKNIKKSSSLYLKNFL